MVPHWLGRWLASVVGEEVVDKVVGEYDAVEDLVRNNTLPGLVVPTILGAVVAGNQLEVRTRPLVCCCCASSNVALPPSIPPIPPPLHPLHPTLSIFAN